MALTYDTLNSVCTPNYKKTVYEQAYDANEIISRIKKGNRVVESMGLDLRIPISYGTLGDAEMIDPDSARVTVDREITTALSLTMKFAKVDSVVTWEERNKNYGAQQIVDLVKEKTRLAIEDMNLLMSTQFYLAAASQGSNDMIGIFGPVQTTATSYGGVSQSDASNWNAGFLDAATAALALYGTTGSLWYGLQSCWFRDDYPDLMVTTKTNAGVYASKLQPGERRAPETGKAGATDLFFNGVPILADPQCTANNWFVMVTKSMFLYAHPNDNFSMGGWEDDPDRYKALRSLFTFCGNFAFVVRRHFGAFTAITG
jgi:hypothetical protein